MPTLDYKKHLLEDLSDPDYAAGYLTAALEEGEDVFLLAIRDVAEAHGGIGRHAEGTSLNRENLYSMLSESGNPRLSSLMSVLRDLGVEIQFRAKPRDTDPIRATHSREGTSYQDRAVGLHRYAFDFPPRPGWPDRPSGSKEPSGSDRQILQQLADCIHGQKRERYHEQQEYLSIR